MTQNDPEAIRSDVRRQWPVFVDSPVRQFLTSWCAKRLGEVQNQLVTEKDEATMRVLQGHAQMLLSFQKVLTNRNVEGSLTEVVEYLKYHYEPKH